jgi:hypothetical protein
MIYKIKKRAKLNFTEYHKNDEFSAKVFIQILSSLKITNILNTAR